MILDFTVSVFYYDYTGNGIYENNTCVPQWKKKYSQICQEKDPFMWVDIFFVEKVKYFIKYFAENFTIGKTQNTQYLISTPKDFGCKIVFEV